MTLPEIVAAVGVNQVICGNAMEALKSMADESVQMCMTSPPYWGLRSYKVEPVIFGGDNGCQHEWQIVAPRRQRSINDVVNMESKQATNAGAQYDGSGGQFCLHCNCWRGQLGLEPDPELFISHLISIFDEVRRVLKKDGVCFVVIGDSYMGSWGAMSHDIEGKAKRMGTNERPPQSYGSSSGYLKPKNLCMIPARFAIAMQKAGWWLRQDIIWSKPNPMPESVTDRCTKSHEYIFLFAKSADYFWDQDAIREPYMASSVARLSQDIEHQAGSSRVPGKTNGPMKAVSHKGSYFNRGKTADYQLGRSSNRDREDNANGRNARSVWEITTEPSSIEHFATFPKKLVRRCVLAGSRVGDTVLDPFAGIGTVGLVCKKFYRKYLLIELSEKYCEIAKRLLSDGPLLGGT